ncbi:hypothetical protein [Natrarchaeobaculum sulfurireducens]|uniref:DUF7988 domain-containing protein n=1 Tax=Natrarchaeobaculum sulfurireducens TaxID=2044521 RepID=A0A346PQM8_9EURY|nr:hypothetical protein [Natrarchaeobaculum sulfurireducens]AXR81823.1 hypothetical protein AArcMg_1816 [Natrarchaeobaculum sulfurireducens]
MSYPIRDVRRRIHDEYADVVAEIDRCADAVADARASTEPNDREPPREGLQAALEATGVIETLPAVLAAAVDAAGFKLRAQPVPAPPYVVVTSRGPMLRATIDPGRLVVRFDVFEVERDGTSGSGPTYRRLDGVRVTISLE